MDTAISDNASRRVIHSSVYMLCRDIAIDYSRSIHSFTTCVVGGSHDTRVYIASENRDVLVSRQSSPATADYSTT